MALLYLPLLVVAGISFNASRTSVIWKGFSLHWYARLARNELILEAARNTLLLALASTLIATVLGTALALGMQRFPWPRWFRRLLDTLAAIPVVTPDIVFATGMLLAMEAARLLIGSLRLGLATMIVAHVTFQISFVALVVGGRLATIGRAVEEAARDLYADAAYTMKRVILPLLLPGIVAGALLAFTLSIDDFVISFFTSGPTSVTLPLFIYGSLRRGITPEIHALSTVVFLATVLLVLALRMTLRNSKED